MRVLRVVLIVLGGLFLLLSGGLGLAALVAGPPQFTFANASLALENRLLIPPVLAGHVENGEKVFNLAVQAGTTEFWPGTRTPTLGFNGHYLGPTIRVRTGDKIRLNVTNHLSETTTIHWHGMHLPAAMDGGPHQVIAPGATWQPYWTITNAASTLWYHPHEMAVTGDQVYRGLAGLFLIDDATEDALALPHDYGLDDIPLVVQDRQFDSSGQSVYRLHNAGSDRPPSAGMLGDTILVNGTRAPYVAVPQKLIRLRLLNASNGRRYDFGFADNHAFSQIASDGGLLDAPVVRTRLLLAPGERAEILVDLGATPGRLTLLSYPVVDNVNGFLRLARDLFGPDDENQEFKVLELRPQAGSFARQAIPQTLAPIQRLQPGAAATTRRLTLGGGDSINGKALDDSRVDLVVKKGDVEIWAVQNQSVVYHSLHIHDVQFLVLDRDGKAPPAYEAGWKDTVIVNPFETIRLIMQFKDYADPTLPYMFHCHILEHEDLGMMGQFVVVENLTDTVRLQSPLLAMPGMPPVQP